jgi:MerR family transcriptional regulator, light-induced transcriptional regulator
MSTAKILAPMRASYLTALHRGSGREADRVVEQALEAGVWAGDIYLDLFQPVAYRIGALWQQNLWTVAEEHLATAIIERQMDELHTHFTPATERGQRLLIGSVEHEAHRVGCRMVADFFEADGWTVHYLGASVPTEHVIALAREIGADLIGLGAQTIYHVPTISAFARMLGRYGMDGLPIMAGGLPFVAQPDLYRSLGVQFTGRDARDAVRRADVLLPAPHQRDQACNHQAGQQLHTTPLRGVV